MRMCKILKCLVFSIKLILGLLSMLILASGDIYTAVELVLFLFLFKFITDGVLNKNQINRE
jgi:hypothetical protein